MEAVSKYGPTPANRGQIEEICRLVPERKDEVWSLVWAGLTDEQAQEILAEARKPRIAPAAPEAAERLHAQSAKVLARRQRDELEALKERRHRDPVVSAEEQLRQRYQAQLDFWAEQALFAKEQQHRLLDNPVERYDQDVIWRGTR
jgi:hypothetical protein